MFRRVVAASFVAAWLVLLGIEFSEDTGLFAYDDPRMDKSVEGTLASLGKAIKASTATQVTTSHTLSAQPEVVSAPYDLGPYIENVSSFVSKERGFLKAHFKIHKLHQVFLI